VPFSEINIDQEFVTDCATSQSRTIVESSVEMARWFGIKTVGEGVGTQEDWYVLKTAGCDVAQGYFIANAILSPHAKSGNTNGITRIPKNKSSVHFY
jgi:EAL domain-containing protein (putative c-di-GMP-specific phosphodiesterase class I)